MIRKGRKPKPQNEEERLKQEEEKAASKLREKDHRNERKRNITKLSLKFNTGPLLGDAKDSPVAPKRGRSIQKRQLEQEAQHNSRQINPKLNNVITPGWLLMKSLFFIIFNYLFECD